MKKSTILWFVASICEYIAAFLSILQKNTNSTIVWLCLGSAFLCIGVTQQNKTR